MFKRNEKELNKNDLQDFLIESNYLELINVACSLTIGRKVNVNFGGDSSYTDGKNIQVGLFDFILYYEKDVILYCLTATALHEAEHIVSTDFNFNKMIDPKYENDETAKYFINSIFNGIEDGRIERIHISKYKNNNKYIKTMRLVWHKEQPCIILTSDDICELENEIAEEYAEEADDVIKEIVSEEIADAKQNTLISNLIFWTCTMATVKKPPVDFEKIYKDDEQVNKFCDTFKDKIIKCVEYGSCKETLKLSEEIYEYMNANYGLDEVDEDMISQKILILAGDPNDNPGSDFIEEDLSMIDIDKNIKKIIKNENTNTNIIDSSMNVILDEMNLKKLMIERNTSEKCPYVTEINILKNKVKEIMDLIYHDEIRGLKSGKVKTNNLWKVALNETAIMYKPKNELKKNIALYLLIDASGSMGGYCRVNNMSISKIHLANRTGAVLEESFCEYLNLEVAYFNGNHIVIRKFDDDSTQSFVWKRQMEASGGNCDYENLEYAINKLKNREENKKFIFIISDGMPCDGSSDKSAKELVREKVVLGKKYGISTVAFTVETDEKQYRCMYDNIVGCSSNDLQNKLLNIIKKIIV